MQPLRQRDLSRMVRFLLLAAMLLVPSVSGADVLTGYLEWDYDHATTDTRDVAAGRSNSTSQTFLQKYNIMLNKSFFPLMALRAGYLFESDQNWLTVNDRDSHNSITTSLPSMDLLLGNPLLNASFGYNRRKETLSSTGTPSSTSFNEDYHATVGWRPEGLPSISLLLGRTNTYDDLKATENRTVDRLNLGLTYVPLQNLDTRYLLNYNDQQDLLHSLDVTQVTHSGRVSYSSRYLGDRGTVYGSYNVSYQTTSTSAAGTGIVDFPVSPFAGLSAATLSPGFIVLDPNPALVDGNVTTGSGINIGTQLPPQLLRNLGFDFLNPTPVNRILVWIDRKVPDAIARLYTWDVYTSRDNQIWQKVTSVSNLTLDPFENRFEINLGRLGVGTLTSRYVKVVVAPLSPAAVPAGIPNFLPPFEVNVTEIQAFQERPAETVRGDRSLTAQALNLGTKIRLLDLPAVYYDGSIFYSSSTPTGFSRYTLSNGLLADHRFNDIVACGARAAWEDSDEPLGHRDGLVYNATVRLTPLSTITNTFTYAGRTDFFQGRTSDSNSVFVNNTLQIYRGVDVTTGGGVAFATNETGDRSETYNYLLGVNITPRKDMSFTINYTFNDSTVTPVAVAPVNTSTKRGDFGVTYRPFTALYLLASWAVLDQTGRKTDIFQNYGINWSPLTEGTLQFSFAFSENLRSQNQEKSRLISPGLTWKIAPRATLDLSYPITRTESVTGTTESQTVSAILRITL